MEGRNNARNNSVLCHFNFQNFQVWIWSREMRVFYELLRDPNLCTAPQYSTVQYSTVQYYLCHTTMVYWRTMHWRTRTLKLSKDSRYTQHLLKKSQLFSFWPWRRPHMLLFGSSCVYHLPQAQSRVFPNKQKKSSLLLSNKKLPSAHFNLVSIASFKTSLMTPIPTTMAALVLENVMNSYWNYILKSIVKLLFLLQLAKRYCNFIRKTIPIATSVCPEMNSRLWRKSWVVEPRRGWQPTNSSH